MLLEMQHIVKRYPGVVALDDVTVGFEAGTIHCIVGENGAGKSTLVKILSGAIVADGGTISLDGTNVGITSPTEAQRHGIGVIHQDFKLVPELTVAENISLGHEVSRYGLINTQVEYESARATLDQLGETIPLDARIASLDLAQRQMVEIAKALSRRVRILALDEPTASLTGWETEKLFRVLQRLKTEGVSIIYVSHRLEEIFTIGDEVTILRDGRVVHGGSLANIDRRGLIRWMVGRELENEYPTVELHQAREILRVENLSAGKIKEINLSLYEGEILGIGGLVGAGRTELARLLFGADQKEFGDIYLDGRPVEYHSPHDAIQDGIALLTEDRNRLGLILQMNVRENISLATLDQYLSGLFIHRGKEADAAQQYVSELHIRPMETEIEAEHLSGGNRQKVVLARWLNTQARVLIFDEPTAGIDVGARFEIYTIINRIAQQGIGVIVISSDLQELLGICTRIAVMCEGRITGVLDRTDASQDRIMTIATTRLN